MMDMWQLLIFVVVINALQLAGVFLGGWLVFRVKKDGEPIFLSKPDVDRGQAFNLDDDVDEYVTPEMPPEVKERADNFIKNFADSLGPKNSDISLDKG